MLGICAGMQLLGRFAGGRIDHAAEPEIGELEVEVVERDGLFRDVGERPRVWHYHFDELTDVPDGFRAAGLDAALPRAGDRERGARLVGHAVPPRVLPLGQPRRRAHPAHVLRAGRGAMNLDDVDGRFGEAWAGTSPDGSHINIVIGRRGSPTAAAAAAWPT